MRRDLRDKPEFPAANTAIESEYPKWETYWWMKEKVDKLDSEKYQLEQEVEKLRAENVILHEEIRLREVIMGKKGREALRVKK